MYQSEIVRYDRRYTVSYTVLLTKTQVFASIHMDHMIWIISWLFQGPLRKKDKQEAQETKARVLATFMCIVVDEHFKRAEYVSDRVYHWNGQGRSEDESTDVNNLKDRELWKIYKWQSKIDGDNPERRDLPQYENLKDYILHMFVESEGMLNLFK